MLTWVGPNTPLRPTRFRQAVVLTNVYEFVIVGLSSLIGISSCLQRNGTEKGHLRDRKSRTAHTSLL